MTPTAFGRFLEFSIPTNDIQESLNFYRKLGFSELPVGDIRNYHYGVVTDSRIVVGLHAGGNDESSLSFVKPDVVAYLQGIKPDGGKIIFSHLGIDEFHEIGVQTPDGQLLTMLEARTFSQARLSELPIPFTGRCTEISLGCRDLENAKRYWIEAGFMVDGPSEETGDSVELLAPGLRLGLHTDMPAGRTALRFAPDDPDRLMEILDRQNIPVRRSGNRSYVTAPEGTQLVLGQG